MMNQKDILTALQNGENPEVIAQNFADALNAAIAEHNKAAEAAKVASQKNEKVKVAFDAIVDVLEVYYPEVYDAELRDVDIASVVKALDEAYADFLKTKPMLDQLIELLAASEGGAPVRSQKVVAADPITKFLHDHNL